MSNRKIFLILFLFLIVIGTLSTVSANDSTADTLNNASCDEIGINEEDIEQNEVETIESDVNDALNSPDAGTFNALQEKIYAAESGSTIELENDYYYKDTDGNTIPMITKSLTINGNGYKIDGSSKSALLRILGQVDVTLNNITFVNGTNDEVIRIDYTKSVEINNCNFYYNEGYFGGAMVATNSTSLTFNGCVFNYNEGYFGGALEMTDIASASFYDCYFVGNFAHTGGAIHMSDVKSTSFIYTNFGFNYADYGGGIYILGYDSPSFITCIFMNNTANATGGAIYFQNGEDAYMNECYIVNNSAFYAGGLYVGDSTNFEIEHITLEKNHAHYGGALILSGYDGAYINYCDFNNNDVFNVYDGSTGGAIYIEKGKKMQLTNTRFTENMAVNAGALYLGNAYDTLIKNCEFTSNYGVYYGGALNLNNNVNKLEITSSNFTANYAFWGGAIYSLSIDDGEVNLCNFNDNQAVASGDDAGAGGAVYMGECYNMNFNSCNFNKNYAKHYCGAVSMINSKNCNFNNCRFIECFAPNCGGVAIISSTSTLTQCVFLDNLASEYVGALTGGTAIDCTFSGNSYPQTLNTKIQSSTKLTISQSGSTSDDKVIIATLTNANDGSAIANQNVKFNFNGKLVQVKTNSKGQAILKPNLASKTYSTTISLDDNDNYIGSRANVNVVVQKATPKISASKKTFKLKMKTKKYKITLKDSLGKGIKNAKVTIKIKNKKYSAKTNANGQATFKLKLTKTGKFKSSVTFAGNGYYNSVSKKVTITVKR